MPLPQVRSRHRECDRSLVSATKAEPLVALGPCRSSSTKYPKTHQSWAQRSCGSPASRQGEG